MGAKGGTAWRARGVLGLGYHAGNPMLCMKLGVNFAQQTSRQFMLVRQLFIQDVEYIAGIKRKYTPVVL